MQSIKNENNNLFDYFDNEKKYDFDQINSRRIISDHNEKRVKD